MTVKNVKRCSPSLVIREMQMKTTVRYCCTPIRLTKINLTAPNAGEKVGKWGGSHTADGTLKWVRSLCNTAWQFLKILNVKVPYDPAIVLLSIYSRGMKLCPCKNWCIDVLAALFAIIQHWKQPRCASVGEWLSKLWCVHTRECYGAIKRKNIDTENLDKSPGN